MRLQPDGLELLRAARVVVTTAIAPHLRLDRRDLLPPIERAFTLGEDLLTRDAEPSVDDLTALETARTTMRNAVLEALPEKCRFDARLVAKAIALAKLQLAHGHASERREYDRLSALLGAPNASHASAPEMRCTLFALNERLCARIRAGDADADTTLHAATRAHLEATTDEALSETSPTYRRPAAESKLGDVSSAAENAALCDGLRETLGEAVYASGQALISTQVALLGWLTQRLAANPDVPMLAVEGAHQAHDLSVAVAEATLAFWTVALAPFRSARSLRAQASRLP